MISPVLVQYLITYGPALISGIILVLCFPKPDLFLMSWIALVPFSFPLQQRPETGIQGRHLFRPDLFFRDALLDIPFYKPLRWYFLVDKYRNRYAAVSLSQSLPRNLCILVLPHHPEHKTPGPADCTVFWVVLEFLRTYVFTGFPWSSIGYSQYQFLSIIQIADITGIYGVSFLIVAVNGALADLFLLKQRTKDMPLFRYPIRLSVSLFFSCFSA